MLTARSDKAGQGAAYTLLSSATVRERAHEMLAIGLEDGLPNFRIDTALLDGTASFVADVIRLNYPDLAVPLHARWRHFRFAGRDLWADIARSRTWRNTDSRARTAFDLAIVSVLLDAGAGADWRYRDDATRLTIGRSEGLALASLRMFESGVFSSDRQDPLRADAERLARLTAADLAKGFQADADNPLNGIEGRAALLAQLGLTLLDNRQVFAMKDTARPGGLFDRLAAMGPTVPAPSILRELLVQLGPIWPSRITLDGVSLGDTWRHSAINRGDTTDKLVPLHKLSQWLTYSLIEPMQDAGIQVTDVDGLTGLAEYRNGGLFIDMGVVVPRDPSLPIRPLPPDAEAIVEWRALTVALLDRIAPIVKDKLGIAMPLGSILEGGTWSAGRRIAKQKRPDGRPPLNIVSDGTVF